MSNFSDPQSRNEAIIQNILGASNVLEDPQSRNETILQAILNNSSYTAEPQSRIEEILIAILNGQSYNKTTYSRNEAILKAIANGGEYTAAARSRMETLLLQWLEESGGVEKTVTGNPITVTDAKAESAIALSVEINPVQSGSGDPSPTNIRPITGWSAVELSTSGADTSTPTTATIQLGQTVYGGTLNLLTGVLTIDKAYKLLTGDSSEDWNRYSSTGFYYKTSDMMSGLALDGLSNIAPTKTKVNTYGALFGSNNNWIYFGRSQSEWGVSTVEELRTWLASHNIQVVYPLANPQTVQLTPTQVELLAGTNNIWANGNGDLTLTYLARG